MVDWVTLEDKAKILALLDCNTPKMDDTRLGEYLREYVSESDHGGWDGFSSRDMTGIWRFLKDLYIYVEIGESEPKE